MRRELPVRFREGLGVKFPRATRLVIGFAREDDARRVMEVLPKRLSKYGLTIHPEKTRLVRFQLRQDDDSETEERDPPEPRTFDFLGFTHYWGRSQRGGWVVKRKTANSRLKRGDDSCCRNGVGKTCTSRSGNSTRSSCKSCEATLGITGSLETTSASWNSGRKRRRIWRANCLDVVETVK